MTKLRKGLQMAICLLVAMIVALVPSTATADDNDDLHYTEEQKAHIVDTYFYHSVSLQNNLESDTIFKYWQNVHENSSTILNWGINISSWLLNVYPDKEDYIRILSALMTMMSGDFAEEVNQQKRFDDLKSDGEYLQDTIGLIAGIGGDDDLIKRLEVVDEVWEKTDWAIHGIDMLKYYVVALGDYSQTRLFLEAIVDHAEDTTLCEVAESLIPATEALLEERIDKFGLLTDTMPAYDARSFLEDYSYAMLSNTESFDLSAELRQFVDISTSIIGDISKDFSAAMTAFDLVIFLGDMAFGTTNTFDRYQEMRIIADIADSLVAANDAVTVPSTGDLDAMIPNIRTKCQYYQSLLAVHARGAYLQYSLVTEDGGQLSVSYDAQHPKSNTDVSVGSQYDQLVDILKSYDMVIESIFDVSALSDGTAAEDDNIDAGPDDSNEADMDDDNEDVGGFDLVSSGTPGDTDVMLVLDISSSMDGTPLADTKDAASAFVDTDFDKDTRIGLVAYATQAEQISPLTRDDQRLHENIDDLSVLGNTNIEDGLSTAQAALDAGGADKKIIVLMSDGEPNEGLVGDDLIDYADSIRDDGIRLYTLGFNEGPDGQRLLAGIADEGRHYEVQDSSDLTGFFSDIADEINGTRFVYIKAACPIEITVSYDGETLSSAGEDPSTRTSFGTLTFEASDEADPTDETDANNVKVLRLREGPAYDVQISGTGDGSMTYTIGFVDDDGEYNDFRTFSDIAITPDTAISTSAEVAETTTLRVDEDGDGTVDKTYRAGANEEGQLVDNSWIAGVALVACIVVVAVIAFVVIRISISKNKRRRTS